MTRISAEQRRRDLIDAAVDLLVEQGPSALTARRIAERAGASVATVHYAFRDMDELLTLVATEVLAAGLEAIGDVRTDRGVRTTVEDFLMKCWAWMRDSEEQALAFFETFVSMLRPATGRFTVTDTHEVLVTLLREAEENDSRPSNIPLPQLAYLMIMIADGLTLIHLSRQDADQTSSDVRQLIIGLQALI